MAPSKVRDEPEETLSSPHDPGLLAASLEGRLDPREREVLTAHLAGCAECREALALLARAAHEGLIPRPTRVAQPGFALHRWLPLAAAAALVITVATVTRLNWSPTPVEETRPSTAPPGASISPPPSPSEAAPSPASSPEAVERGGDTLDPGVLVTRGAGRRVAGKTFRLAAGEWIDASYDAAAGLPITEVKGPDQRSALLSRLPGLTPYAALGERVLVVFEGTAYRLRP
jgi:putative zinc finger protein